MMMVMAAFLIKCIIITLIWKTSRQSQPFNSRNIVDQTTDGFQRRIERLSMIRQDVMRHLNWSTPPTVESAQRQLALSNWLRWGGNSVINIVKQTIEEEFIASCEVPPSHSPNIWFNPRSKTLNVNFDVNLDSLDLEGSVDIINSTISLHVKNRTACHCDEMTLGSDRVLLYFHKYTGALNSRRYQRRGGRGRNRRRIRTLIDVMMLTWNEPKWITFNITEAATQWVFDSQTNKGVEIVARDMYGSRLIDAKKIFSNVDCSILNQLSSHRRLRNLALAPKLQIVQEITPGINGRRRRRDTYTMDDSNAHILKDDTLLGNILNFLKKFL